MARGQGTLYRRKRSPYWWAKFYVRGRPVYRSTGTPKVREAERLLKQWVGEVTTGRIRTPNAFRLRLSDGEELVRTDYVIRQHKSWNRTARSFAALRRLLGDVKLADVTPTQLKTYVMDRLDENAARSTIQKELAAIRRAYTLAMKDGLLASCPAFPGLGTVRNARREFIEAVDWALLRPELPEYWQDMGDMALVMGWRSHGELKPLRWRQVDWDAGVVFLELYTTKNDDARFFPFDEYPDVQVALERRRTYTRDVERRTGQREIPYVFHVEGHPLDDHRDFYGPWKRACRRVSVLGADGKPKRPHDFRRSAVRSLENAGVPRGIAKQLVGHRTDSMYERYAITNEADTRSAVRRLREAATVV